jgi:S1-C subfamily serine protease
MMFTDVPPTHWIYNTLQKMLRRKAVTGYPDGSFIPEKNCTRAETVGLIDKALTNEYEVIKTLLPSVVQVTAKLSDGKTSLGSGVILDKQGHIATNCHVVLDGLEASQDIFVYLDNIPTGI